MSSLNENSLVEQPLIELFTGIGYEYAFGPDLAPGSLRADRSSFKQVVLEGRLRGALRRLNPDLPDAAIDDAYTKLTRVSHPNLVFANRDVHRMLTEGVTVEVKDEHGERRGRAVRVLDFEEPLGNDFLVVNQFSVEGPERTRRPDAVVFVNGLPLAVFELKSPTDPTASVHTAYHQLHDYKKDIPDFFIYNQVMAVSDLPEALFGTISSSWEWFSAWKAVEKESEKWRKEMGLRTLVEGMFDKRRFLDIIQNFIVFEADAAEDASTFTKKICKYHQYYGIQNALHAAERAMAQKAGDRKIGVFWHTQGSGKSLSMAFFVNAAKRLAAFRSPTFVFLTDRNDLDDQLYKTFLLCGYATLAKQASSVADLKDRLAHAGGELIFTTIQKFQSKDAAFEKLTDRDNIIVIADEAHRSEYAVFAKNARDAMPNASFMGITGTPVSLHDRDTVLAFGDYISEYPIHKAVEDKATVPIYYESRLVPLHLANDAIDEEFDALVSEHPEEASESMKRKLASIEETLAADSRLKKVAEDVVAHFNGRGVEGKAMVVTVSRRAAVRMYELIKAIPGAPESAVVISKPEEFKDRIQSETHAKTLERKFKDPADPLKFAIVCDMWLTGFDVPPLHTMYLDKPLANHTLMQAIARVNRIYRNKEGGLIVDYVGVADNLKKALNLYSSDIRKEAMIPIDEIVSKLHEKHDVIMAMLSGVRHEGWRKLKGIDLAEVFIAGMNEVITDKPTGLPDEHKKKRFLLESLMFLKLHDLLMPNEAARSIADDAYFVRSIRHHLVRSMVLTGPESIDVDATARELVSKSLVTDGAIDIFELQGFKKPDVSIFNEAFLEEVRKMKYKNLAIEVLRKLLQDEIRLRLRTNKVRYGSLSEMLKKIIEQYRKNLLSSAETIKALIEIAGKIKEVEGVGEKLGMDKEETAFYDVLVDSGKIAPDDAMELAKELNEYVRACLKIDWTTDDVAASKIRANARIMLLRRGIDAKQGEKAIEAILQQAKGLYEDYPNPTNR